VGADPLFLEWRFLGDHALLVGRGGIAVFEILPGDDRPLGALEYVLDDGDFFDSDPVLEAGAAFVQDATCIYALPSAMRELVPILAGDVDVDGEPLPAEGFLARPDDVVPIGAAPFLDGHASLVSSSGGRFGILQLGEAIDGTACRTPTVTLVGPNRSVANRMVSVALRPSDGATFVGDDDGRIWRVIP
jgi:hypothetical protein